MENYLKRVVIFVMSFVLVFTTMPWTVLADTESTQGESGKISYEDMSLDEATEFADRVLNNAYEWFAPDVQEAVKEEIDDLLFDISGASSAYEVMTIFTQGLIGMAGKYELKDIPLEDLKNLVKTIVGFINVDYYKPEDREAVSAILNHLEEVCDDENVTSDIIKSALMEDCSVLVKYTPLKEYQFKYIDSLKKLNESLLKEFESETEIVKDSFTISINNTISAIEYSESEQEADIIFENYMDYIVNVLWRQLYTDDLNGTIEFATHYLSHKVYFYPEEQRREMYDYITRAINKIEKAKTVDEVYEILDSANEYFESDNFTRIVNTVEEWRELGKRIADSIDVNNYVDEDRTIVLNAKDKLKIAMESIESERDAINAIYDSADVLDAFCRTVASCRQDMIAIVCGCFELVSDVCGDGTFTSSRFNRDINAILIEAVDAINNETSSEKMMEIGIETYLKMYNCLWNNTLEYVESDTFAKIYIVEDREGLSELFKDLNQKVKSDTDITQYRKRELIKNGIETIKKYIAENCTTVKEAQQKGADTIISHADEALKDFVGDKNDIIQAEISAMNKVKTLESQKDIDDIISTFDMKVKLLKWAAEKKAAEEKEAEEKAAEKKEAEEKAAAEKKAAEQKLAEKKMVVKGKKLKASSMKKTVFKRKKAFKIKNAPSALTFTKTNKAGKKKITVSKKGKVTVKKGLKKGTYKVKVTVVSKPTATLKSITKKTTVTVVVK